MRRVVDRELLTNWALGKFRDLQRLTVQYARILGLTADGEEEEGEETGENGVAAADEMEVGE